MTTITLLSMAALFPGIFLLVLAICKKMEDAREVRQLNARMQQRARADSDAAWLRNKQTWMK